MRNVLVVALGVALASTAAGSHSPREPTPPCLLASTPTAGADLFRAHCASCHGVDARGAGPVAEQLRGIPPDLTAYALRNGGVFPRERLRQIIEGRHVPVHGTTEMPVWGWAFMRGRGVDGAGAQARIDALISHLESLQKRPAD
ncbi:MAG: cytochrome c [Vicinamibacterales bacterium]|nr:cytochrome c [Vicinamibacterales bacterium]